MRRSLAVLLFASCGWPGGLAETAAPGRTNFGFDYPDLLAPGGAPTGGDLDAAVIVAIEDYTHLEDRPGAEAMASAWYHYFRVTRSMKPRRISLLRGAGATPRRIARAIERARFRIHRRGTLWFIYVGHVSSAAPGEYGEMWLREGEVSGSGALADRYPMKSVLDRIAYGSHPHAVAVFDGCLAEGGRGRGGQTSGGATPPTPPFRPTGKVDETWIINDPSPAIEALNRVRVDSTRARREPANVAIFTAGLGLGCVEQLPGTRFPALSYLLLGGLRGWADRNRDGTVTAVEALTQATLLLRAGTAVSPYPQLSSFSADIPLAVGVSEPGPTIMALRPPGRPMRTEAELLSEPMQWTRDDMVAIDRGWFRMGCPDRRDPDCEDDERPAYRVHLSRFLLDPLEVTQAQYQQCVDAGRCVPRDLRSCFVWTGDSFVRGAALAEPMTRPDHPVVCVNWPQAQLYCAALGKRLPSEAEWERAAAGTSRRRFPWGDGEPSCARAQLNDCGEHSRPVGEHPEGATPEGVHDLAGNVSEWVQDWYEAHEYDLPLRHDPAGPGFGRVRVIRGGSYYDGSDSLRAAYRYGLSPTPGFSTVGFRCAR